MSDTSELKALLSPTAGILLPAGQAALTGFATGTIGLSAALAMHLDSPLAIAGLSAGFGFGGGLLFCLSWWRGKVNDIGKAIEQAPAIYARDMTRVQLEKDDGRWIDWLDLPLGRETMIAAAVDLMAKDFQTSNLGGRGKALTRSQAEALRDFLIAKELAWWIREDAHTAGWQLGGAGRAIIRHFAALSSAFRQVPTLPAEDLREGWQLLTPLHTHTNTQGGELSH